MGEVDYPGYDDIARATQNHTDGTIAVLLADASYLLDLVERAFLNPTEMSAVGIDTDDMQIQLEGIRSREPHPHAAGDPADAISIVFGAIVAVVASGVQNYYDGVDLNGLHRGDIASWTTDTGGGVSRYDVVVLGPQGNPSHREVVVMMIGNRYPSRKGEQYVTKMADLVSDVEAYRP